MNVRKVRVRCRGVANAEAITTESVPACVVDLERLPESSEAGPETILTTLDPDLAAVFREGVVYELTVAEVAP
jgi:hypothetical protein